MKNNPNCIFYIKKGTPIYKNFLNTLISMQKQPNIHCKQLLVKRSQLRKSKANVSILPLLSSILKSNPAFKRQFSLNAKPQLMPYQIANAEFSNFKVLFPIESVFVCLKIFFIFENSLCNVIVAQLGHSQSIHLSHPM